MHIRVHFKVFRVGKHIDYNTNGLPIGKRALVKSDAIATTTTATRIRRLRAVADDMGGCWGIIGCVIGGVGANQCLGTCT